MAWTAPRSWSDGEVPTGSIMNAHTRDNELALGPAQVTTAGDLVKATGANALARLAIGTAGQRLAMVSGAPAWASPDDPWWVDIDPLVGGETNVNWSTLTAGISQTYNGVMQSGGSQNDEITFTVVLSPGTWTFRLHHYRDSNRGIYTVQLDGVTVGTVDGYNPGAADTVEVTGIAGIAVSVPCKKTLKLKMASKNASSSGYYGLIQRIVLFRTA